MAFLTEAANRGSISTGYDIDNSLKFEADNSEQLYRTPSSAGNQKTWTYSVWFKRTELGASQQLISAQDTYMYFETSDQAWLNFRSGSENFFLATTRLFRDTSAWYHAVIVCETANSTAADRAQLWINGVRETSYANSTYQNLHSGISTGMNSTNVHRIGQYSNYGSKFSGYMAEINLVDGQALDPTYFGEFNNDGIWIPKEYTGTYGTNGFYLDFADADNLGDDESGNGNDWTAGAISSVDQATDTPTNNFCTWSSLWAYATNRTISEGSTKLTGSSQWGGCKGSIGVTNGKWYWENKASGNDTIIGWQTDGDGNIATGNAHNVLDTIGLYQDGNYIWIKDSTSGRNDTSASGTNASGQIIGFALDLDSSPQTATFYRNGSAIASNVNIDGLTGKTLFPFISQYNQETETNFGGYTTFSISSGASDENGYGTFEYAPPSGYYSICTKNLAEYG
tara:strand:- start:80 stop:1441 length:1362 start_codon:yes stop_codon:yes gene_type:complete